MSIDLDKMTDEIFGGLFYENIHGDFIPVWLEQIQLGERKQSVKSLVESVCMEVIGENDDMSAGNHIPKHRNQLRNIQRQSLKEKLGL